MKNAFFRINFPGRKPKQLAEYFFFLDNHECEVDGSPTKIECRRILHCLKECAKVQGTIEDLRNTSYDGKLTWKIADLARCRHEAVEAPLMWIHSPTFYTSRRGKWLNI